MKSDTSQQTVDSRNLVFTIGAFVIVLLCLTVFLEKKSVTIKSHVPVTSHEKEKTQVMKKLPVIPKTTFNIQPVVTRFTKFLPLPDFNAYKEVDKRKAAFIDYLTPIVEYQNRKILRDRVRLEQILKMIVNGETPPENEKQWLQRLADKYDVEWKNSGPGLVIIKLARRVDIIPVSLALVQAAKESSWGRSRYAIQANNLFGQWCYDEGCGVVPDERASDAVHEVKSFETVNDATRSYILNLNTHPQYATLRQIRQYLRVHHKPVTGSALANGLLYYSQRRQAYIEEVKSMIRQYQIFQERRTG